MPTELPFTIRFLEAMVFSGTRNRFEETDNPGVEGAMAALDTFYHALNERSLQLFHRIWLDHALITCARGRAGDSVFGQSNPG